MTATEIETTKLQRLQFLAKLPTLLNSSLDPKRVTSIALQHLKKALSAEAATLYLCTTSPKELMFWALEGGESGRLQGKKISSDIGVVGWVVRHREGVLIADAASDPRFYSGVDREGAFVTRNMICVPLIARGEKLVGAIQVLNKVGESTFVQDDLDFIESFAHQLALAIDNAILFQEAQTRAHQLAVLDRRRQEMITVITHEFRTPVSVIQSAAEMLAEAELSNEDRAVMLRTLHNGVERMSALVAKIHMVSHVTDETLKLNRQQIPVSGVFRDLHSFFTDPIASRAQTLEMELGAGVEHVSADYTLLLVALKNLISNAIRSTPDGGVIRLAARKHAGLVELSVADNGIGISAAELPLVFEKFYEVGKASEHSSGTYAFRSSGLGLGLAAVKAIIQAHGSAVEVQSEAGKGSVFSFCLPG
ncbi:MAG: HAMP domain-containing sensor histidine kinase [Bdellovibrionota bacterium]